jgi:hypothetical protein
VILGEGVLEKLEHFLGIFPYEKLTGYADKGKR